MTVPQTLAALLLLIGVLIGAVVLVARAGDGKWTEYRRQIAENTPPHYQGRDADFDEWKRPW